MPIVRWSPSVPLSQREQFLVGRMVRTGKLFAFLRKSRHQLFDDAFQAELEAMYADSVGGKPPVAPALLAMVILLQAYTRASDAQAVELSIVDARWQMVLDVIGEDESPFSQGALSAFRQRLIAHDMDRRLLERTIELAKQSTAFDWKKLPKELRVAIDSRLLEGAGRVEDTFNLLAHAARKVINCVARLVDATPEQVARSAGAPLLVATSVKAGLDIEWSDPVQKAGAIGSLVEQLDRLEQWITRELGEEAQLPPLAEPLATLRQLREQDLDPEPPDGKPRIRQGTVEERRVSVEDKDMRHGRTGSRRLYDLAAATYRSCSEPIAVSEIINEIAVLEMERGKGDDAILLYEDVIAAKRAVGNTRGMVGVLNNLGSAHSHIGKLTASERYYRQSLAFAELHGIREPQGATLYNLGDLMLMHEDLRSATLAFNRSLDIAVKTQEHMFEVFALEGKFGVSLMRADLEQAEDFLTQAARAADVNRVASRKGAIVQHRAQLAYPRGGPDKTNELCNVVVPRARENHEENRLIGGLPLCAMTAALVGDLPLARRLVDEARVVTRHLAPTNVRRASIGRADAFSSLLAHDYSRCLSVVEDTAKGTEREALLGPSADLRMMAALARDGMHDSATAKLELGAAALLASRSADPRSRLRVRAASARIARQRSQFDEVLRECSRAGLGGLADELRALAKARERGAVPSK